MNIPLSNDQIIDVVGDPADDIILYKDLHKFNSIEELFKDDNLRIILIETKPSYGHWVSLIKDGDTYIYFNSYGFAPDHELQFLHYLKLYLPD